MNQPHVWTHRALTSSRRALWRALVPLLLCLLPSSAFAAFGYIDNGSAYVVDTGAGLVFQVRKSDGTVTSFNYNGVEYNGPSGKGSHIASGLGSTGTAVTADSDGSTYVKITLQTDSTNGVVANLTHYIIVRNGENTLYMATYANAEPNVGELRWITRLKYDLLSNGPKPSDNSGNTGAIESSDVFGHPDGTSTSKYYGDTTTHGKERAMDLTFCGASGNNVGVWMVYGSRESSSGGPFFRDIQNQSGAGGDQEIYNYMNSGHNQTEANRVNQNLHGPYALVWNNGSAPSTPIDFSWMGSLGINGWFSATDRGAVSGTATGIPAGFQGVVGLDNSAAQYWGVVNPADGSYTVSGVKPGVYQATLYKGELEVAVDTVTVTAGATTTLNLTSTETRPSTIFRIGEWDGTPAGFLNADHIPQMHPSDVRNADWGPFTYVIGTHTPSQWPAIQMRARNSPMNISLNLAANQITNLTLRIGITCAYNGGRPSVTINGTGTTNPGASNQPSSRSFTIGTYRGNNTLFTYTLPASALVTGTNTISIGPISGSSDLGTWLSAGYVIDAIELDGPIATPVIAYVGSNPLVISGTAEGGRNITVSLDGTTVIGTTVSSASGAWSLTYASPLSAGSHSFTAVASDNDGHSSPTSAVFTINTGLSEPAIAAAIGDTGTYSSGATTSDRVFYFTGTADPNINVAITQIGTGVVGNALTDASGNWLFDYTSVSLPDGANSFYATATTGGSASGSSPVFTLNLQGAPRIAIVRQNPTAQTITAGFGSVIFRVTFNTTVSGVSTNSFALGTTNTAAGTITGVSASSGSVFDVTVGNLAGTGNLRLDLKANNGIVDGNNNPEGSFTAGQYYSLVTPTTGNGVWTQTNSGGNWGDPRNWLNAVVAEGTGNTADFTTVDLTSADVVHLESSHTAGTVTFGDANTTTAGSWFVDNNGNPANMLTLAGGTPTIAVNALGTGATATISAGLAGTTGLTKAGNATLVLSGASSLTGTLNISGGTLQVATGGALNNGNNAVNLTSTSSRLNITGGSFTTAGLITANANVVIDGGTSNIGSFRTNADFGVTLRINGGNVTIGDVNIRRNAGTSADFTSGFVLTGGSTAANTIGLGTQNSFGCMSIESTASLVATGPVTVANQTTGGRGGALRVIGNATFTSTDSALGVLMCRNNGTNTNNVAQATFTGGVSTVEKFTLGFDSTVTAGSATITVNGGTLYLGSGGIVKNGAATMGATLTFSSGIVGAKANWSTALPVALASGGNVNFKAADAAGNPFSISLNGVVSGAGGFTKTGSGTLTLDGGSTHTYTGATTINGGALRVTSTLATAANGVTVNNGGILTGNGTINRAIALNAGGAIAPDGVTTIATLNGTAVTWNGGGGLAIDLGANGTSDLLALTGALAKGSAGAYNVVLNAGSGFAVGNTYTIATFGSTTFTAADLTATGLPAGTGALFVVNPTNIQIKIQGQPTITSAASAGGTYGAAFSYTIASTQTPATYSATGLPPGLSVNPVSGLISGTPAAAGTFNATVTATNTAGSGSAAVTVTIAKAIAGVSLNNLSATYTGAPHGVTVTTTPAGLGGVVTYNGTAIVPTNANSYTVIATIDDPNYVGTASGTLVIGKANPTIAVTPYAVTYDGNAHTATGTATGMQGESLAGLVLGGTTHTNAGAYAADGWTFTDATGNYNNATGTVTDNIAKANATINVNGYAVTYDGNPHTATGTVTGVKAEPLTGLDLNGTSHTNAGTFNDAWAFTDSTGNYNNATGSTTDTIGLASTTVVVTPYTVTYDGNPHTATGTVTGVKGETLAGLNLSATTHTNAGTYASDAWTYTDATGNYANASGTVSDSIAKAAAAVTVTPYTITYDGDPHTASGTVTGVKGEALAGLDLSGSTHTNAGSYASDAWTFTDTTGNYSNASGSVADTINKAVASITVTPYNVTYDSTAHTATGSVIGTKGESVVGLNLSGTTHTNAGTYSDVWTFTADNYLNASGTVTDTIAQANATVVLSGLSQMYDGTPKSATATTVPTGLNVDITYGGSNSAPTLPGSYAVIATINDANYHGSTVGTLTIGITALVRHAPSLNGDLDGSIQVLTGESLALNGNAGITGDLLVVGTPSVRLNGQPTFGGIHDGAGNASPSNYTITLNGNALLRFLVRRVDPIAMPTVAAPQATTGTRDVSLNSANDVVGDFSTVRDLTLNGNAGSVAVPAGAYRYLTASSGTLVLGVAGSADPVVYNVERLTLNGTASVRIVGPVLLRVGSTLTLNGQVGTTTNPEWLRIEVANGGVSLNGNATLAGNIVAPNGTVVINGNASVTGTVAADRLTINGNGLLKTAP